MDVGDGRKVRGGSVVVVAAVGDAPDWFAGRAEGFDSLVVGFDGLVDGAVGGVFHVGEVSAVEDAVYALGECRVDDLVVRDVAIHLAHVYPVDGAVHSFLGVAEVLAPHYCELIQGALSFVVDGGPVWAGYVNDETMRAMLVPEVALSLFSELFSCAAGDLCVQDLGAPAPPACFPHTG